MRRERDRRTGGASPWGGLRRCLIAAAFGLLAACSTGPDWTHRYGADNPLVGQIYDVAAGRPISERELEARLSQPEFVLIGEVPGNADQARLAGRVVAGLTHDGRPLGALALESLPTDTQPQIVEYLAAHPRDAAGLDRVLQEAAPDRPHLAQFTPAVTAAVMAGAQVVAADLSADTLRAILTHGYKALPPEFVLRTGLAEPFATPIEQGLRQELQTVSCERANGRALAALVQARRARDATMADRLAAVTGRGQSVLVAALPHVRTDRGVPWYLRRLRPNAAVVSLGFVELPDARTLPTDLPYDYAWFTPAARPADFDPCRQLPAGAKQPEAPPRSRSGVEASLGPLPSHIQPSGR